MRKYDKEYKRTRLSCLTTWPSSGHQRHLASCTIWRQKRKVVRDHAFVGSGVGRDAPLFENERRLMRENAELRKANKILKDALDFFAKDRKK